MNKTPVNIVLLIGSVILSLLVLEGGVRLYHLFIRGQFTSEFDAELGWIPKAGLRKNIGDLWGTPVATLDDGIRSNGSREVRNAEAPILAVGDSFTFGDQVSDWETWPAQLEKLSGRSVTNGGVFAYALDQTFLRARQLLSRHRYSTVIFSLIPDDIKRCQFSAHYDGAKPYFDFKDGRLTLENVPVPPPPVESGLFFILEHSHLLTSVVSRALPKWWQNHLWPETQVLDEEKGREVSCALLHELEGLTKSRGSELIILAQHGEVETPSESIATESVLSCLSDPATRILDLQPALSELKAKDPSRYHQLYNPGGGHMSAEGNQFVAVEILPVLTER